MAAMPGVVTLLPLDQSNPSTSRIEENTSARQRRRKTSRNTDSKKSTRSNLTESGLELVSLESSGSRSPRDWPRTGVSRGRGNIEDSRGVDSQASALGSSGPQGTCIGSTVWHSNDHILLRCSCVHITEQHCKTKTCTQGEDSPLPLWISFPPRTQFGGQYRWSSKNPEEKATAVGTG